jgi:hypothetical protein
MMQPDLLQWSPPVILGDRDGETFDHTRDGKRLNKQMQDIYNLMADGRWRTLTQIASATLHPEPSVSARLRDLRKSKFGGYIVERRFVGRGLYEYRLVV